MVDDRFSTSYTVHESIQDSKSGHVVLRHVVLHGPHESDQRVPLHSKNRFRPGIHLTLVEVWILKTFKDWLFAANWKSIGMKLKTLPKMT